MNISRTVDCVVFGGSLVEQVIQIPRLPSPHQDNVPFSQMQILPGGSGGNVAVYLARLGVRTQLLDRWGNDSEAEILESAYQREGVDIRLCRREEGLTTPFMIILTLPDKTWTGITRIPEAAQLQPGDFPIESVTNCSYLHLHGFSLSTNKSQAGAHWAVEVAKHSGVLISLDACTPVASVSPEVILQLVPHCHLFFANVAEAQALTHTSNIRVASSELLSLGPDAVIIKAGEKGCYLRARGQKNLVHCPAISSPIVDTIGAGDAVVAGVLAGRISGLSLEDSLRLGVATAALVCQGIGAQSRRFRQLEALQLAQLPITPKNA